MVQLDSLCLLYSVIYQKMRNQISNNEFIGKIEPQIIVQQIFVQMIKFGCTIVFFSKFSHSNKFLQMRIVKLHLEVTK